PGQFKLGNQDVIVDENLATWAADRSHLMGSAGTMPRTANNLRHEMELPEADVAKLLVENPRRAIGWEDA
ncbi:MAG: hypothetical protein KDB23_34345, partial [Planctomycetales bacterium]|nr:hypothetical protein [Planctomycetales bacterium]